MLRNTTKQPKKRTASFQFRVSFSQRQEIAECAEALGLSDSGYILAAHRLYRAELKGRGVLEPSKTAQAGTTAPVAGREAV